VLFLLLCDFYGCGGAVINWRSAVRCTLKSGDLLSWSVLF